MLAFPWLQVRFSKKKAAVFRAIKDFEASVPGGRAMLFLEKPAFSEKSRRSAHIYDTGARWDSHVVELQALIRDGNYVDDSLRKVTKKVNGKMLSRLTRFRLIFPDLICGGRKFVGVLT